MNARTKAGAPVVRPRENPRAAIESPPRNHPRRFACLLAGGVLAACTAAPPATAPLIQSKGDNMSTSASPPSAPRDAAELLARMLALIDAIHEPEDLTPGRMTQFIGLPMRRQNDPGDGYFAHQELTDMWESRISWRLNPTTKRHYLYLSFDDTENYRNKPRPPMTGICRFDLAQFHDELLKRGYGHVGNTRASMLIRRYRRGSVDVEVGYEGESSESLDKISHDCIRSIYVDFVVMLEEIRK
jgi:hypothetical protein